MSGSSFFFYDLETSGFHSSQDRIMQFAGQRTDLNLKSVGEPINVLIKLSEEVLPSPDAILVTGITPQKTLADGITEAEFLKIFTKQVAQPGTIFVGFNSIRFDDEFMRFLHYRNFYDPYEWQWQDGRSRWDLLDLIRMTRALRPEGIKWPVDSAGKSANRLEMLTSINGLNHSSAHDALSDVLASIDLARLVKSKQPKLFDYLLNMRDKKKIAELVNTNEPFVYSSGKYDTEFEKTTVVIKLADHPKQQGALVYDLRFDPEPFLSLSPAKIVDAWKYKKDSNEPRLPIKTLKFNRCPAIAPLNVLDKETLARLGLDMKAVQNNLKKVTANPKFVKNVLEALGMLDKQQQESLLSDERTVDMKLYDGFYDNTDKIKIKTVRDSNSNELGSLNPEFKDKRLQALLPLYKARNFPSSLSDEERQSWAKYVHQKLFEGKKPAAKIFFERLEELTKQPSTNKNQQYILEELRLYGESLID